MEQKKYIYIYDINRANYYMEHGVICRGTGINPKSKMTWFKFVREETNEVWDKWVKQCDTYLNK